MYANLRKAMRKKQLTQAAVAQEVGITLRGFNLKLLHRNFTSEEMIIIHSKFFPDSDWKFLFKKS